MYHNFFIHSFVDGHLGCFYVLAIVNSVVVNIGVHVSLSVLVSLHILFLTGEENTSHYVSLPEFFPGYSYKLILTEKC